MPKGTGRPSNSNMRAAARALQRGNRASRRDAYDLSSFGRSAAPTKSPRPRARPSAPLTSLRPKARP